MSPHPQATTHSHSLEDPETFWSHHAARLHWHRKPSRAIIRQTKTLPSGSKHDHWSWFADGEISTAYNCVDRHVIAGNGENIAIVWESPVTGITEKYTYARLLDEVEVLAGVLREEGVQKGDIVIIYSMNIRIMALPLSPESKGLGFIRRRGLTIDCSADDPRRAHRRASYHSTGRSPCGRVWRLCAASSRAAH